MLIIVIHRSDGDDEVRWLCSVDTREEIGCDEEEENVLEEGDDQVEEEDDNDPRHTTVFLSRPVVQIVRKEDCAVQLIF